MPLTWTARAFIFVEMRDGAQRPLVSSATRKVSRQPSLLVTRGKAPLLPADVPEHRYPQPCVRGRFGCVDRSVVNAATEILTLREMIVPAMITGMLREEVFEPRWTQFAGLVFQSVPDRPLHCDPGGISVLANTADSLMIASWWSRMNALRESSAHCGPALAYVVRRHGRRP
jgi:hypothetical protein